jgi:MoxR-like ATPase
LRKQVGCLQLLRQFTPCQHQEQFSPNKTLAALEGRAFVTPDDVRVLTPPALRHRIVLRAEAKIDGQTPDSALARVLARVPVPR